MKTHSSKVILLAAIAWCYTVINLGEYKKNHIITEDVISYYSYLPATFIKHDLKLSFLNSPGDSIIPNAYWSQTLPSGEHVFKMSMGLSFLYSPFFFMAHIIAKAGGYAADGFSIPYQLAIGLSGVFYACIGLLFVRKLLLNYYTDNEVAITLLIICFGTNLYNYASKEAAFSHAFSFFLFATLLWFNYIWHKYPSFKKSVLLGLIVGLIILVRPSNFVILFIPMLYGVIDYSAFKAKILFLKYHYLKVNLVLFCILLPWIPQLLYWKYVGHGWLIYTYLNEQFYFLNPHLAEVLFSFRKGWFVYTPLMLLSIVGLFLIKEKARDYICGIVVFLMISIYVISSWWCWWYGGSYGMRTMVESYAILAIPLAAFIHHLLNKKTAIKNTAIVAIAILCAWNLYLNYQYKRGVLHYDSMTAKAYSALFISFHQHENAEQLLSPPDYEAAMAGKEKYNWK